MPHLHLSVFRPNKTCNNGKSYCDPPPNGWGYSELSTSRGDYIDPEVFFTDSQYCLKP